MPEADAAFLHCAVRVLLYHLLCPLAQPLDHLLQYVRDHSALHMTKLVTCCC